MKHFQKMQELYRELRNSIKDILIQDGPALRLAAFEANNQADKIGLGPDNILLIRKILDLTDPSSEIILGAMPCGTVGTETPSPLPVEEAMDATPKKFDSGVRAASRPKAFSREQSCLAFLQLSYQNEFEMAIPLRHVIAQASKMCRAKRSAPNRQHGPSSGLLQQIISKS